MSEQVKDHVLSIIRELEHGFDDTDLNDDGEPKTAYDYLQDALDINWILNNDRTYKGARVLVAFGGPNIWIDTSTNQVEGHWWGDNFTASYTDKIGLDDTLEELFAC